MIPGLDYLIRWRMAIVGGPASVAKRTILDAANAAWIARGRPAETINGRLVAYLLGLWGALHPPGNVVRSITAGQPGTFAPATAPIPTFAQLQSMHPPRQQINPLSPWPVADYVVAAGGEHCAWTGFDWVVKP